MAGARIIYNHFPKLAGAMRVTLADVIQQTAEAILDRSDASVARRTGALARSGKTQYADDGLTAIVGYDDFKAVWIEYGTGEPAPTRAEPYLTPAAEGERGRFEAAVRSIEPRLRVNMAGSIPMKAMPAITYGARDTEVPPGATQAPRRGRG